MPGDPCLYGVFAPAREFDGLHASNLGKIPGVVFGAGVADNDVLAVPREQVVAEKTVSYG